VKHTLSLKETMTNSFIFFALVVFLEAVQAGTRQSCAATFIIETNCNRTSSYLIGQLQHFANPDVQENNYFFYDGNTTNVNGKLTAKGLIYKGIVDDLNFALSPQSNFCQVSAFSKCRTEEITNFGRPFCDLFNLFRGGDWGYSYSLTPSDCRDAPWKGWEVSSCNKE